RLEKLKLDIFKAATNIGKSPVSLPTDFSGLPISTIFFKIFIGLSLNLKFLTGLDIFPFLISNTPSLVKPVSSMVLGSTVLIYQKRVTSTAFSDSLISCSVDLLLPCIITLEGYGIDSVFVFSAQNLLR